VGGVSFVYFDINGCLVRFFHRAFTELSAITCANADVVETAFWQYNDRACRGDMTMDEFNAALAKELGVEHVNWMDYYMEAIEPIPVMHELAAWAAEHYHIGLLTNIMPGFVSVMREKGLIPNLQYDAIIDSSEVGAIKPEAKIFEVATKKAGVPAAEILLVDDSRANLMAAGKQGWRVLWFDDYRPDESADKVREALQIA
jgi:FMN phosphatase YigB (HAD superfamily)